MNISTVLRAPNISNISGHRNWFCKKAMLPFGSHQAPKVGLSHPPGLRSGPNQCVSKGPFVPGSRPGRATSAPSSLLMLSRPH